MMKPQVSLSLSLFYISTFLLQSTLLPSVSHGLGVNWGLQTSHPLPPSIVARLLKANGILKVKLFDTNSSVLNALLNSDIEVMLGIPNELLRAMSDESQAVAWVQNNVVPFTFSNFMTIKYVAVGNEPFLESYNGAFLDVIYPALVNIQKALNAANLGDQIKATVPMNADIVSVSKFPSSATFRPDISSLMTQIVVWLRENSAPYTVNIYPFIDLHYNDNFPADYAFFDGSESPIVDGAYTYQNAFEATFDSVVAALAAIGPYDNMEIIVGAIGWPTDGGINANVDLARKFNQGFLDHVTSNQGTPRRPKWPIEFYLFSMIDEDSRSIKPGSFERHWGIFSYDGIPKYALSLPNGQNLVQASGVPYLTTEWCTYNPDGGDQSKLGDSITYACANSDCTSLGYGASCNSYLDVAGNASYAFNQYFQRMDHGEGTCNFNGLGQVVAKNPSVGTCKFTIQIAEGVLALPSRAHRSWNMMPVFTVVFMITFVLYLG